MFFRAVYPPLAEMTDEDKANSWKPGQKKKKSEKVDSTWNPKSKLVKKNVTQISCYTDKAYRGPTLAYRCTRRSRSVHFEVTLVSHLG